MGVQNATLLVGGTVAASGGTSTAFVPNGAVVSSGIQIIDSVSTNNVTRANITLKTIKQAVFDMVKGVFTGKTKRQVQLVRPKVLANGSVTFPLIRLELEFHPDNTDAEITALLSEGAQLLTDVDFSAFWRLGNLQ